jgi:precorrin-6B C5,15-methyltransferase / cobalt-precorrin-6B C5,C15-methyltransferase
MITIVGIGSDGWAGLGERARGALATAGTIVGSRRQLDLLPPEVSGERTPWPSPLEALVDELVSGAAHDGATCVLASGDPMLHGVGATLARRVPSELLDVHPHPSAFAYACARLGWAEADVELVSAVGRPVDVVARALQPRRRVVVYATGTGGAAAVARVVCDRGFAPSQFVVLEQLGGPDERIVRTTAGSWGEQTVDPLHAVAIECVPAPGAPTRSRAPGLPDDAFEHDGALTKRAVRAVTLSSLAPGPDELLWDIGAGSGSIAIEWLRCERTARAIAIEDRADRADRIATNARELGVPELEIVVGRAPEALADLPDPDAIFIGGGLTGPDLLDACWQRLAPGGRLVANAVTLESESLLLGAHARLGGALLRLDVSHADPVGRFTAWRAQLPIVQWSVSR